MRRSRPISLLLLAIVVIAFLQWRLSAPAPTPEPASPPAATTSVPAPTASPSANDPASASRYDLARDESRGGHTLARHVGRSDADLLDRLRREPDISAASTYTDRAVAERVVAATLTREKRRVDAWTAREGSRPNLALDYRGARGDVIGRSVRRGRTSAESCTNAVVVLRWQREGGFIVLTSYPEAAR